jgi:hypothetical protein
MLFFKSQIILDAVMSFANTDNVVNIGYFFEIISVESNGTSSNLIDTHGSNNTRKINECIEFRAVPSFAENPSCSDKKFYFSQGKLLCDRENIFSAHQLSFPIYSHPPYSLTRNEIRIKMTEFIFKSLKNRLAIYIIRFRKKKIGNNRDPNTFLHIFVFSSYDFSSAFDF